jgi:hypothetical protein
MCTHNCTYMGWGIDLAGENIGVLCPIVIDCTCGLGGVGIND